MYTRGRYIIGFKSRGFIKAVTSPSVRYNPNMIYDRTEKQFEQLSDDEMKMLGVELRVNFVSGLDQIIDEHRANNAPHLGTHYYSIEAVEKAEHEATYIAQQQAGYESLVQARNPNQNEAQAMAEIKRVFINTYQTTFHATLSSHGGK